MRSPLSLTTRRATVTAVVRVVVAGTCWGLSAVIARKAFDRGVAPVQMAEARILVAFVPLLAILALARRDLLRPPPGSLPALVGFGLCVAGVNASYYVAIDRLEVGVAISIQYTGPVLLLGAAALSARAGSGRSPGRLAWVAGGLTLVGAVLVSRAYRGLEDLDGPGLVAAALSAFLFAGYLLTAGAAGQKGAHPATVLLWGFVVALAFWTVAAPWWSWPVQHLDEPPVVMAVLGVGFVATLIPFFLSVGAVRVISPATAGIAATIEPPAAAGFAWIFLNESLGPVQLLGGALVVAAVILAHRSAVRREVVPVEIAA